MLTLKFSGNIKKLGELSQNPEVDIWAMDEVRFQQHGSRCRMWIPPEDKEPVLLHHPTHRSIGYFGAVRLRDGKFIFKPEAQRFNAQTFWDFLKEVRLLSSSDAQRVVLMLDNARYHHAKLHNEWRQEQSPGFVLDFLPPYSPELNPIERVWRLVRRLCIHNRYFPALEHVIYSVEKQFAQWACGCEALRTLCAIN